MILHDFGHGLLIGLVGGTFSGLLGVSSGGFLVALVVLILGLPQHIAQGISLVAQVPPTSLSGVMQYRRSGHAIALRWIVLLSIGFVIGAVAGAFAAGAIPDRVLRWAYVGYLLLLGVLALARLRDKHDAAKADRAVMPGTMALLAVGIVSGLSSGLLGIGGGLAITAILAAGMKVPQHVAQALALRRHDAAAHPAGGLGLCRADQSAVVGDCRHRRRPVVRRCSGCAARDLAERTHAAPPAAAQHLHHGRVHGVARALIA